MTAALKYDHKPHLYSVINQAIIVPMLETLLETFDEADSKVNTVDILVE